MQYGEYEDTNVQRTGMNLIIIIIMQRIRETWN
jgi:hypothetical protein